MSTRSLVFVKDNSAFEVLYAPSDGYLEALGTEIVSFAKKHVGHKLTLPEVALGLMKEIPGLVVYHETTNPGLDFVYTIPVIDGVISLGNMIFQEAHASCSYKNPIPKRLSKAKSLVKEVEVAEKEEEMYRTLMRKLEKSILKCPCCRRKPSVVYFPSGQIICCRNPKCSGSSWDIPKETFKDFETAVKKWNQRVVSRRASSRAAAHAHQTKCRRKGTKR